MSIYLVERFKASLWGNHESWFDKSMKWRTWDGNTLDFGRIVGWGKSVLKMILLDCSLICSKRWWWLVTWAHGIKDFGHGSLGGEDHGLNGKGD